MTPSFDKGSTQASQGQLGTFGGVFTPSILTILGIILFLRLGFVVGEAGLTRALIIIGLANVISVLTSISLAAVATNLRVKGGGDYYLISRTLGLEFGGAIGIVLFLAQSVSIGFYCIGFGEAVSSLLPWSTPQLLAALAAGGLFVLAWLGADWATRFQYLVMAALTAALASFFIGGILQWDPTQAVRNLNRPEAVQPFWVVFAVFFPAVTGFTQGVSMSGDLKDPGKSLPRGTFAAVGLSALVYVAAAAVLAGSLPGKTLQSDYQAMQQVAVIGPLVLAGVIAATLSSAMASFLGAPRILQSLAGDRIFPFLLFFARGAGPANNPRRGVFLSAGIALGTVALGRLNLIAPVVSMFFLISYGLLNYATYFEARSQSPSFRPRFRFYHPYASLAGALACLGIMLAISPAAGITALAVLVAIYQYLKRTSRPAIWADSQRSYHLQQIRSHLLSASEEVEHPRHWRPQILAFSDHPERRGRLLQFCTWIEGGSGLTTMVRILEGRIPAMLKERAKAEEELAREIHEHGSRAFPLVITAPDLLLGIEILLQSYGVGPLQANTVVLNWFQQPGVSDAGPAEPARNLRAAFRLHVNIVLLHAGEEKWKALEAMSPEDKRIDVWWWGGATSRLMLILAYLMTRDKAWEGASIRVLALSFGADPGQQEDKLAAMLENFRIDAESMVVDQPELASLVDKSRDAALVLIPFSIRPNEIQDPFGGDLNWLLPRLPVTGLCLAAEDIELDADPEEGKPAQAAALIQDLEERRQKHARAGKDLDKAEAELEAARSELNQARQDQARDEDLKRLSDAVDQAENRVEQAEKRVHKAKAQEDHAYSEARNFDPSLVGEDQAEQAPGEGPVRDEED
jgi:amino acid transporter